MSKNAAWVDKVGNFLSLSDLEILNIISRGINELTGEPVDLEQKKAWEGAIPHLKRLFKDLPKEMFFAIEYELPMSNERIDLLLFGKSYLGRSVVIIFELKGWHRFEEINKNIVRVDGQIYQHPRMQILNYIGKIKYCHSLAKEFEILGAIWMYNSNIENLNSKDVYFFAKDIEKLLNFLKNNIMGSLESTKVEEFVNGEYTQSTLLFQTIKDNFNVLKRGVFEALCAKGAGPSEEQLKIIEEIIANVRKDDNKCYIVYGPPGSGKSYIAVLLLLNVINELGSKSDNLVVLGYRNNRLINTIRKVFSECSPGLDGVIKFYSTGRNSGLAEGNASFPHFKLVIYDEAQRMKKSNIKIGMQRGDITVFFFDDTQILNADEEGWRNNFISIAEELGIPYREIKLEGIYRVRGGKIYHQFIENLLTNEGTIFLPKSVDYELKIFSDIEDLLLALKEKAKNYRVALVASFTESPGDRNNPTGKTIENLRIGYPLYSGFEKYKGKNISIYWLMDEKVQYPSFWLEGESNRLTHCASIYGCQGFEADYIGVIWGRDFVRRGNSWELGDNCEDSIGNPSLKKLFAKAKKGDKNSRDLALKLLINRYRIFLTRGILGTFIYCEDDETLEFLKEIVER